MACFANFDLGLFSSQFSYTEDLQKVARVDCALNSLYFFS